MKPVINLDEVEFDDIEDNGRYTSRRALFSERIGARQLGYNLTELRTLTFNLGLDYEEFHHETMSEFTFELLTLCERRNMLDALLVAIR